MNFHRDESILMTRFQEEVVAQYPEIVVDYVGKTAQAVNHRLIRFRVARAPTKQIATRNGLKRPMRNYGSVLIFLTVPTGDGPGEILEIADAIGKAFNGYRNGGLLCRAPSLSGPSEKGAFIEATVDVPFTSDYHA